MSIRLFSKCTYFYLIFLLAALFFAVDLLSFQEARVDSQREPCFLFVFLDDPSSPWSERLEQDILQNDSFLTGIREEIELIKIPIKTPFNEECEGNDLIKKFSIREFPTLVLVDHSENQILKVGYLPCGPEDLAYYLTTSKKRYFSVKEVVETAQFEQFTGKQLECLYTKIKDLDCKPLKMNILNKGLKSKEELFFLLENYELLINENSKQAFLSPLRKRIEKLDPENKKGSLLQVALLDFRRKLNKNKNRKAAIEPLINYMKKFGTKNIENLWKVNMIISQFFHSIGKDAKALKYAEDSYKLASQEAKREVVEFLDYLKIHSSIQSDLCNDVKMD